ncbi:MAG: caa(3)-type oxidase, subunit [Gemmatimonadales bacterium]|nr:caa(3)-type oxidase, subunit [Gemmatimonadales bacterium]
MVSDASSPSPGMRFYTVLWAGLLGIVIVEVLLTYAHLRPLALTLSLIALALIEAGVALMYFMHLKYERRILFWSLIPALVFVLVMFDHFWPDAFRVTSMRLPAAASSTPASGG